MADDNSFGGDTFGGGAADYGGGQFGSAGGGNSIEGIGGAGDGASSGSSPDAISAYDAQNNAVMGFMQSAGVGLTIGSGVAAFSSGPAGLIAGSLAALAAHPSVQAAVAAAYRSQGYPTSVAIYNTESQTIASAWDSSDLGSQAIYNNFIAGQS